MLSTADFDYPLPKELIAQSPLENRDASRLMIVNKKQQTITHGVFMDILKYLQKGDALVINETRVIPARLLGIKKNTNLAVEILLLKRFDIDTWEALVKPGRKLKVGARVVFGDGLLEAEIIQMTPEGGRRVRFYYQGVFEVMLDTLGQMPLPPYIHEQLKDKERYQTVYAKTAGSAAAPTAGLHFTKALLEKISAKGVWVVPLLLHVGLGTFRPVKVRDATRHVMHAEYYEMPKTSAQILNEVRRKGGKIFAVGTTSCRVLETVADERGYIHSGKGWTDIFIYPGYNFKCIDGLITNFHLPESTLLMLVCAFAGRSLVMKAYAEAVAARYRFFSFGDAMLLTEGEADV